VGDAASPGAVFWRAIQCGNVIVAESVAGSSRSCPSTTRSRSPNLYADKSDRRFERAALRYLERYISEANPSLRTWPA
jgi:hypothetical protein